MQEDVETMPPVRYDCADIVISFGLIYNLENPIVIPRHRRELARRVPLIEMQTTILDPKGAVDSGHSYVTNYVQIYFRLFSGNPDNIDGSASYYASYTSSISLIWALRKLGF